MQIRAPIAWNLTKAEARVVENLAQGRRPIDIATELSLSIHTVRTQLKRAMAKAGVHTQTALVAKFYSARIMTTGIAH
jgi:DNA-binding CsgD family transcriptional regulator